MKQKLLLFLAGFLVGGCMVYLLSHYATADDRTLAQLYPAAVGLRISHDLRVLTAIESNEVARATNLLRQDIDSNVNSLLGLGKSTKLDEHSRAALAAGQNALKPQ